MTHYMTALAKMQVSFVLNRENAHRNGREREILIHNGQFVRKCASYQRIWNYLDEFLAERRGQKTEKTEPQRTAARL
jgi:hypothetical protein